jgi:propionyl-CoA synthetase
MQSLGVAGDRVLIYMPMIAEAAFAMLACARIGAMHSVVFGGFAANSLASRIDDAKPVLIVSADAGSRGGKAIPTSPAR